jgi:hypothetical protein
MTTVRRLVTSEPSVALGTAVLATLAAALILEVWNAPFTVPWIYSGDGVFYGMVVKGILDHGWHYTNPNLGAPGGQQLYDFPIVSGENLQALIVKLLGVVSSDWAVVMNLYFLLTFALTAAVAFVVLRRLGSARGPAVVCAALFALLPYHFARGENELFVSSYYAVPLGAYLVLAILADEPLFTRRAGRRGGPLAWASRRSLVTIALCLVVVTASASYYFALFTTLLVVVATLVVFVLHRSRRALGSGIVTVAVICVGVLVTLAPAVVYRSEHGTNDLVRHRSINQSEIFALKLTQLVLPVEDHRVEPLAHLSTRYADTTPFGNLGRAVHLGAVGAAGFAWLLVVAVIGAASRTGWRPAVPYRDAATANLVALLIGTVGGLSVLFAAVVTPQFRAWNRISVFIGFFALLAVALALTALGRRWSTRRGRLAFGGLLLAILVLGALDQTGSRDVPRYDALRAEYRSDARFVQAIERRVPAGAEILQLPYVPFPEAGRTGALGDYDLARPYLHTSKLRWSFGASKGRPEDWLAPRAREPIGKLLADAVGAGYTGLYIDRAGYADRAAALEVQVSALLDGARPLVSSNGRLSFFEL